MILKIYKISENEKIVYNLGFLLEKLCTNGIKVGILCNDAGIEMMEKNLWTFSTNAFVPHDVSGKENDDLQPILLSTDISKIERSVVCIFNQQDLIDVLNFTAIQNSNHKNKIEDIVYMTQENFDIQDIKQKILNETKQDVEIILFEKNKNRWEKTLH